jgi:GH15 family glucan-1,4-alpha-glucosidase
MVPLRFLPRSDPRLVSTVDVIARDLARGDWVDRYRADDGLGQPEVAFVVCTFWLIQALAGLGRIDEARRRLDATFRALSPLGLVAEDFDPQRGRLWGNFPQAYSHVGLIHAAFDASPRWHEVL